MHANKTSTALWFAALIFSLGSMLCNVGLAMESRPLPASATLGTLKLSAMPTIVIDGHVQKLDAGAQIRNEKNLIVQTGSLYGPDVSVLYKKSKDGQIDRIWILTKEEFQRISHPVQPAPLMPVKKTGN